MAVDSSGDAAGALKLYMELLHALDRCQKLEANANERQRIMSKVNRTSGVGWCGVDACKKLALNYAGDCEVLSP